MEFHFLGTGSGLPSTTRNVSGLAVRFLQRKATQWLFDCGEATQHQLLKSPITLGRIDRIFISHLHGDHIFGLPGLLCSRSAQGATSPLLIYGPKGIQQFVETTLALSHSKLSYEIEFVVVDEGIIFSDETLTVEAMELDHVMQCFAYKIIETDQPGTLNVDKLQTIGLQPGPIYQKIKRGERITLSDGTIIDGLDYLGPPKKGRKVVIATDTRPIDNIVQFAFQADLLIHEGTFRRDRKNQADLYGHSTIDEVAKLALKAQVNELIITHISSRYADEENELLSEAKEIFESSYIAYDLMIHKI